MSAFSPWDTGPPGYIPSGSSRIFTNTGGTAPLWNTAPPDYAPSVDESRRSNHAIAYSHPQYAYPRPHYRTYVDETRSTARSDSDFDGPRVRPRHAHVYDGHLEADVETGKTRAIRPRAATSASTSRRYSSARSAVLPETISAVTRSTADSGSRVTYATAVSHMSSRLTYATASSRISRGRSNFASQSSSTISYYTASSSTPHRTPSSTTADSNKLIENLSDWKRYLLQKGLIPDAYEELNWSGRGQHAEYGVKERNQIPLAPEPEGIIGHSATAIVDKVKCRRILLARKTIRCSIRMKRKDAVAEVEQLQKLRHAHIIRIVGTYVIGNELAILLYPVAEWNLESFLEEKPLSITGQDDGLTGLLACFPCLANAVEYMHANTVKHMDIKPQNILIKWAQRHLKVFLADFGIAKSYTTAVEAEIDSLTPFTRRYAAPEVVAQERRGLSADIFSLGCVFTEVLSHFRQYTNQSFLRGIPCHSYEADKNAFHPSSIRNFSYCSNIDMVISFLRGPGSFSTRCWIDHGHSGALSFLSKIRGFLIRMLSPTPSLRPSAREVAERLKTPSFASKCNCGPESPPFEITPPAPLPNSSTSSTLNCCPGRKGAGMILILRGKKDGLMMVSSVCTAEYFLDDEQAHWIAKFRERVILVGSDPRSGLWFPDRAPARHQSQLLLTWPSGGPVAEESEEPEDEVVFEGRR